MGCWSWFKGVPEEAGTEVTEENREKIDTVIHEVIGETSKYEHCSGDWRKIGKVVKGDVQEKKKLIKRLQPAIAWISLMINQHKLNLNVRVEENEEGIAFCRERV